jgi:hypothetical protein
MKLLVSLLTVFLLSAGFAAAQDLNGLAITTLHSSGSSDVTGFHATQAPGVTPEAAKAFPNPKVVLKPQVGGVFVDGAKYGTVMISPTAPAEYGMGEKYLSAPSSRSDLQHESGAAAHRETGGIKLFTFEF